MSFDEEPAVVLLFVPDDAVAFDGAGAGSLALTNLSRASCVCFRVQATDTQLEAAPSDGVLPIQPGFRAVVLANRPGYPFLGNDFFRECGDVFAAHAVRNVDTASQAQLLRNVAPRLEDDDLVTLLSLFGQLRLMHEGGTLSYPYSVPAQGLEQRSLTPPPPLSCAP